MSSQTGCRVRRGVESDEGGGGQAGNEKKSAVFRAKIEPKPCENAHFALRSHYETEYRISSGQFTRVARALRTHRPRRAMVHSHRKRQKALRALQQAALEAEAQVGMLEASGMSTESLSTLRSQRGQEIILDSKPMRAIQIKTFVASLRK